MAPDRDTTLRKAEKLLRQGRLDAAVAEYLKVIEDQPRDWNTANILGDLYVRARQVDKAVGQYTRIADHLFEEGFFSKAAALYKKILKIKGDDEYALSQLAEVAAKMGLLADAKSALATLADRRERRGDRKGAAATRVRLGSLDELKAVAQELTKRRRPDHAVTLLAEAAKLSPDDDEIASSLMQAYVAKGDLAPPREDATAPAEFKEAARDPADIETRRLLVRTYVSHGEVERARECLTREVAGHDVPLLWMLAERELRGGQLEDGLAILQEILTAEPEQRDQLVLLGCSVADVSVESAYQVIEMAASSAVANDEWAAAAAALNEFVNREPGHIPALMRLVEICVDGGLEATMATAQGQLADAYLAAGRGAEARVIAEDLVAREPWDRANIERFRRALTQLGEPDVDTIIAERLSGQSPFTSTDLFPAFEEDILPDSESAGSPVDPPLPITPPPEPSLEPSAAAAAPAAKVRGPGVVPPAPAPEEQSFDLDTDRLDIAIVDQAPEVSDARAADHTETVEVDLSTVLEELKPSMVDSKFGPRKEGKKDLDGVFKDFRDEVTRENVADAASQHFKLAIAYKDMGMIDDAVKALEVAVRAPRLRFEAASMLARIFLKRGVPAQAIEWFERAAEAPAPNPEATRRLLYELADTLESQGETARALAVFLELQSEAGDYRDLAARLERLSKVQLRG